MRRGFVAGIAVAIVAVAIVAFYYMARPAPEAVAPTVSNNKAAATAEEQSLSAVAESAPAPADPELEAAIRAAAESGDIPFAEMDDDSLQKVKVYGTVIDAATGAPLSGAMVYTDAYGTMLERAGNPAAIIDPRLEMSGLSENEFRSLMSSNKALPDYLQGSFGASNAVADSSGAFSIDVYIPSTESVHCRLIGYATARLSLSPDTGDSIRVDFQLRKGASISGKVTDIKTGEPVADVVVRAMTGGQGPRMPWTELGAVPSEQAITSDDGTYTIEGVPDGLHAVSVADDVHGWVFDIKRTANVTLAAGESKSGVDLGVTQGLRIEGFIQDEAGAPIKDANITTQRDTDDFMELANQATNMSSPDRSDEDGNYVVLGLRAGKTSVRVSHENFAEAVSEITISEGQPTPRVDFMLVKGVEVSGAATYEDGRLAVSEMLCLMPASSTGENMDPFDISALQARKYEHTDERDGTFSFKHIPAGEYYLSSASVVDHNIGENSDSKSKIAVTVDGKNAVTGITLVVPKEQSRSDDGAVIAGKVLDKEGNPARDVSVRAVSPEEEAFAGGRGFDRSEQTDQDGAFKLGSLYGTVFTVYAESESGEAVQQNVKKGDTITLRLGPLTSVTGVVVDQNGEPVPGCKVALKSAAEDDSMAAMMAQAMAPFMPGDAGEKTDDFGQFKFLHAKAGNYVVEASSSGKGFGTSEQFAVVKATEKNDVRVVLEAGVAFAGVVVDGTGTPVQGANVSLVELSGGPMVSMLMSLPMGMGPQAAAVATSNADGTFELTGLKPGKFMLSTKHADFAPYTDKGIDVTAAQSSPYRVTLGKGGSARGQFVVDGKPRGNVMIQMMGPGGMQMVRTDSEGRFEVKGLPAGTYMVNPIDLGRMQQGDDSEPMFGMNFKTVTITEGGDVTVTFGGGVAVTGTIPTEHLGKMTFAYLMRKGAPEMPTMMDGMNPFEAMESGMELFQHMAGMASVNNDGTFDFKGIDPGEYELRVYASPMGMDDIDPSQFMNMSLEEMQQQSQAFAPKEVFKQPVTVGDTALTVEFEKALSADVTNAAGSE